MAFIKKPNSRQNYLSYVRIARSPDAHMGAWGFGETPAEAVSNMLMSVVSYNNTHDLSAVFLYSDIYDMAWADGFYNLNTDKLTNPPHPMLNISMRVEMLGGIDTVEPIQYSRTLTPKCECGVDWGMQWSGDEAKSAALRTVFSDTPEGVEAVQHDYKDQQSRLSTSML